MKECEVLSIPVGKLLPGDEIAIKGMCFKLWYTEELEPKRAQPEFNAPAGFLMRLVGEIAGYQSILIFDSRFLLTSVIREKESE